MKSKLIILTVFAIPFFFLGVQKTHAGMNLEVPLEMSDGGMESNTTATVYNGVSQMRLNPNNYNGATYYFEIVAQNTRSGTSYDVSLCDYTQDGNCGAGAIKSTISVSNADAPTFKRLRGSSFTPTSADDIYVIKIVATPNAVGDVKVSAARIIVQQTNATKTRIQIPLINGTLGYCEETYGPNTFAADWTTLTSYTQEAARLNVYSLWQKESSKYANLAGSNPWTFEAILNTNYSTVSGYASLFRAGGGSQVTASEVYSSGNNLVPQLVSASFANNAANFSEGTKYEVKIKSADGNYFVWVHAARLYVTLDNLSQAEIVYRVARSVSTTSAAVGIWQRVLLNTSLFTQPKIFLEASGYCDDPPDGTEVLRLVDHGQLDDTSTGYVDVSGGGIDWDSTSKAIKRTSEITGAITSGNRFMGRTTGSTASTVLNHVWIVVQIGSPPVEFVSIIDPGSGPGKDFTTLSSWAGTLSWNGLDLTASTTRVFSGTVSGGSLTYEDVCHCRGGTYQGDSATVVLETTTQILLKGVSGSYQSGDTWRLKIVSCDIECANSDYFTISNTGDSAIAVAKCRSTSGIDDTSQVTLADWTTSATNYIDIYADPAYRHSGVWTAAAYKLSVSSTTFAIDIGGTLNVKIHDLQIEGTDQTTRGVRMASLAGASSVVEVYNNILKNTYSTGGTSSGIAINADYFAGTAKIWNNIIYGWSATNGSAVSIQENNYTPTLYVYNNTAYNCDKAFNIEIGVLSGTTISFKNNIAQNCGAVQDKCYCYLSTTCLTGSSMLDANAANISEDTTSPDGATYWSKAVPFKNEAGFDFHLSLVDTFAKGMGANCFLGDPYLNFSTDIDGDGRQASGNWDIGADKVMTYTKLKDEIKLKGQVKFK